MYNILIINLDALVSKEAGFHAGVKNLRYVRKRKRGSDGYRCIRSKIMPVKRMCPKCRNVCDDSMMVCPKCGASLSSGHRSDTERKLQSNKKSASGISMRAPSAETYEEGEHNNRERKYTEKRGGQQAVASAIGHTENSHSRFTPLGDDATKSKDQVTAENAKRSTQAPRGIVRRPNRPIPEVDINPSNNAQPSRPSAATPAPATKNAPQSPYPVVNCPMKSTDGTVVEVPYWVTPDGLVPCISYQAVPDLNNAETETVTPTPLSPDTFTQQNGSGSIKLPVGSDDAKEDPSGRRDAAKEEPPKDQNQEDDKFSYDDFDDTEESSEDFAPNANESGDVTPPAASTEARENQNELDLEDDEAFRNAMRVSKTPPKTPNKEKNSLKSQWLRRRSKDHDDQEKTDQSDAQTPKTVFQGFDPNADHYYDDKKPVYAAEKDHVTKDFVVRVLGAIAIVCGLTIAMIYMV